jgi:hypothetical protein
VYGYVYNFVSGYVYETVNRRISNLHKSEGEGC